MTKVSYTYEVCRVPSLTLNFTSEIETVMQVLQDLSALKRKHKRPHDERRKKTRPMYPTWPRQKAFTQSHHDLREKDSPSAQLRPRSATSHSHSSHQCSHCHATSTRSHLMELQRYPLSVNPLHEVVYTYIQYPIQEGGERTRGHAVAPPVEPSCGSKGEGQYWRDIPPAPDIHWTALCHPPGMANSINQYCITIKELFIVKALRK